MATCFSVPNIQRDTVPASDRRTLWNWMFPKNKMRVINSTKFRCYVIVSPTRELDLTSIDIQKLGGINYEKNGASVQEQSTGIQPETMILFELETKKVYVTVFIEVVGGWVRWRRNKCVKAYRDDFIINEHKCLYATPCGTDINEIVGARYTNEEFMELFKKKE
jgi:hypothetical protein